MEIELRSLITHEYTPRKKKGVERECGCDSFIILYNLSSRILHTLIHTIRISMGIGADMGYFTINEAIYNRLHRNHEYVKYNIVEEYASRTFRYIWLECILLRPGPENQKSIRFASLMLNNDIK